MPLGDLRGALAPAHLLVMPEREIHRARRPEALGQQCFDGLVHGHQPALVVDGAAAPDKAVRNLARERRPRPFVEARGIGRHDVLVRHQQDGLQRRIAAAPFVEQAVAVHLLAHQPGLEPREGTLEKSMETVEGGAGKLRRVLVRNGREADRFGQALRGDRRVGCRLTMGRHAQLPAAEAQGVGHDDERECGDRNDQNQGQFFHRASVRQRGIRGPHDAANAVLRERPRPSGPAAGSGRTPRRA
jgi:hypothetical protein